MEERKQVDGIGVVFVDWYDGEEYICTYSDRIDAAKDKAKFKAAAIKHKDHCIAKKAKQDVIGGQILTYMNGDK